MIRKCIGFSVLCLFLLSCGGGEMEKEPAGGNRSEPPAGAQAVSLLGETLYPPEPSAEALEQYRAAEKRYENNPDGADAIIWYGRRTAYLGKYREAIAVYTEGIEKFPQDPRFYRHRGHRYISVREFDQAISDLEKAGKLIERTEDKAEPDGMPNEKNIPLSTLHTNIWYHLGLAYYLKHDFHKAVPVYKKGIKACRNDDMLSAFSHWLYMTYRRLEQEEAAAETVKPIHAGMNIIENQSYHRLCLMYKGELQPEGLSPDTGTPSSDALAYGMGNWYFYNGNREKAETVFREIIAGGSWASFGYIAAEADLAREFSGNG